MSKVKSKSKTGGRQMGDLTRLLSFNGTENQKTRLKTIRTAPHHPFPHHFLIRHNTCIHPFTISYSLFSTIRPVFLLVLPLACHVSLSLTSWCTRDVNNGRFIPPPLRRQCRLHSTSTTSYPPLTIPISPPDASFPMYPPLSPKLEGLSLSAGLESAVPVGSRWVSLWVRPLFANDSVRRTGFPLGRRTVRTREKQIPRYVLHRQRPVFGGDVCEPAIDFSILHIHR